MRYIATLLCILVLCGCNNEVERRREHTLERMDWSGGTAEDQRVQRLIVDALEQADTKSLQSPQLVNVTMRVVADDTKRGSLGVDWISAQPNSDGIRIRFDDGTESDISFDEVELEYNEQEAEAMVLFSGNPFVEREHPHVWEKLLADPTAEVVLVLDGEVVSNEQSIHRIEFGP